MEEAKRGTPRELDSLSLSSDNVCLIPLYDTFHVSSLYTFFKHILLSFLAQILVNFLSVLSTDLHMDKQVQF